MNNILSFIGLCMKAGKLVSGEETVEKALKAHKVKLVILAEDASDNTKKKFKDMCTYRNVEWIEFCSKYELGNALGKHIRATIGILDEGFAKSIKEKIVGNMK